MRDVQKAAAAVLEQLGQVIYGKEAQLRLALTCLLAEGHLLLEDVPGTAKTLLAKALARTLGGTFRRLQCTPDLLPGDVTGSSFLNPKSGELEFRPGPVVTHILLADEINRATPRAQSALLECMAERQLSVEGRTHSLPRPFFVIATQNPVEHEGTFPLPEAQLDRFLMRLTLGYPSLEAEERMLSEGRGGDRLSAVRQTLSLDVLGQLQERVREVHVEPALRRYLVQVVATTRRPERFTLGAGPRATQGLYRACQATAAIAGRDFVLPDDVKALVGPVLCHRVIPSPEARLERLGTEEEIARAVRRIPTPMVQPGRANPGPAAASNTPQPALGT